MTDLVRVWAAKTHYNTGQSGVTRHVLDLLSRSGAVVRTTCYTPESAIMGIVAVFLGLRFIIASILQPSATVYIVASRSTLGFIRDIPALIGGKISRKTVIHVHGTDILDLLENRFYSGFARLLYSHATILIPSSHVLDSLKHRSHLKMRLCENFFDGTQRQFRSSQKITNDSPFTIFWNSNVMATKGFFELFSAVESLNKNQSSIRLLAIGKLVADPGMNEKKLKTEFSKTVEKPWFDYRGAVSQTEAIALLDEADCVALPSYYRTECQPLSLIQAMCAGKRVIVANTTALRATIGDYPAYFVKAKDIDHLSDAISTCVEHHQTCARDDYDSDLEIARRKACARFSVDRFNKDIEEHILGR